MTLHVAVVTGSRAEFGLLTTTIEAVAEHPDLELSVVAGGSHLIGAPPTIEEVRRRFEVRDEVPMQSPDTTGRFADAAAVGRGVSGFVEVFERIAPDWVVVLGDRIEAFAAATAASVAGIRTAHIHGGDRAEGVADDSMRHAITKLSHLHLAATEESAVRIARLGERGDAIHVVGSPAVDGLDAIDPLPEARYRELGSPERLLLHHGTGLEASEEIRWIEAAIEALSDVDAVVAIRPNLDPGSDLVQRALTASGVSIHAGLPREEFIGLLRRVRVVVGNSSAGLIEAAVVGCPAVNLGPRQAGRERCSNVVDVDLPDAGLIAASIRRAMEFDRHFEHPFGMDGVGPRIASILPLVHGDVEVRKRIVY